MARGIDVLDEDRELACAGQRGGGARGSRRPGPGRLRGLHPVAGAALGLSSLR